MRKFVHATMMAVALCAAANAHADEQASEARPVDARAVKVVLDGVIDLQLRQGASAALTVSGDKRYLPKVVVTQSGDTLRIGTDLKGITWAAPTCAPS